MRVFCCIILRINILEKDSLDGCKDPILSSFITSEGFPIQPNWFKSNKDFINIKDGLKHIGFDNDEINSIMGLNWMKFFKNSFNKAI